MRHAGPVPFGNVSLAVETVLGAQHHGGAGVEEARA